MTHVSAIFYYPLKSARGISLEHARLDDRGIRGDRRWMLVDPDGRAVSQREAARLSLVQPGFTAEGMVVEAPGMEQVVIPRRSDGEGRRVTLWDDLCTASDMGDGPADWFSTYLGRAVRMVFMPADSRRRIDPAWDSRGRITSFTDGFPLLFTNQSSLDDLNSRLSEPVPMNRFRPSVVISGAGPWAEDWWSMVRISGVEYDVGKPCERCVMTTIDQDTAESGHEPLRTLATFRRVDGKTRFGRNVMHRDAGALRVGDRVDIITSTEPAGTPA
jgi:uncharacterized protein YcbX